MKIPSLIASMLFCASTLCAQEATWRTFPSYGSVESVDSVSSDCIYVLSAGNVLRINEKDWSVDTYDRSNGLSDTNVKKMAWNDKTKNLLLVYSNSNMDALSKSGDVVNIPDLYNKIMTYSKTINDVFMSNEYAYVATAFGAVKIDMQRKEISEAYVLKKDVKRIATKGNEIYLLIDNKVWMGNSSDNLIDPASWTVTDITPASVFPTYEISPSLLAKAEKYMPKGMRQMYTGMSKVVGDRMYAIQHWGWDRHANDYPQIYDINNDSWTYFTDEGISEKTGLRYCDFMDVAVDPRDPDHLFFGARNGVYEFLKGKFIANYTPENSPLTYTFEGNKEYVLCTTMTFAADGTLWVMQSYGVDMSVLSFSPNREWKSHHSPLFKDFYDMESSFIDSRGILWFVHNHWSHPALCGYDIRNDKHYIYDTFVNNDGTTVQAVAVQCAAEDHEGNIWIGTNVGPLMLESEKIGQSGQQTWNQVKVPRNDGTNLADYLLSGVNITAMTIDGGNRKWFGTDGNGIYVISSDNMKQLHNFTKTNSLMPSNSVNYISINDKTGEAFIATTEGICSYKSNVTAPVPSMNEDNVYAYPNPVTPDYTGPITITGLSYDADVKILSASGHVVAEGRSTGGSYMWNGKDRNGDPVASGVYLINIATSEGESGVVTKIAVVR